MTIKVCGLRQKDNILAISNLSPDYYGMIFYKKSARYVEMSPDLGKDWRGKLVGVFVNEPLDSVIEHITRFGLSVVQLHGEETTTYITDLRQMLGALGLYNIEIFKAFGVSQDFDFALLHPYVAITDMFVFDSKTALYGGSGHQYDWSILESYGYAVPFLLSGGIGIEDIERIRTFKHAQFKGIDVNSCFEISPADKDVTLLERFFEEVIKV